MSELQIQHADDGKSGEHYISNQDGSKVASMHYVHTGQTMIIIDHTEVDESLQGQGVGRKLLDATAEYARKNRYKILATCPYAKAQLEKHRQEYADVL